MKLWILRHARAEAYSPTGRDRDRALSSRGITACGYLNQWLRNSGLTLPAIAQVSPARRTRQTADQVLEDLPVRIELDEELWLATTTDLLRLIEPARKTSTDLMLVGHNPGLEDLIARLGAALPVPGLKPGTLVILDLGESGPGRIDQLVAPRES